MGKKGGGGGGQAPQVNVPAGVYNTIGSTTGLGNYGTALLNPLASMTNWAANLASGGNAGNIPTTQSSSTQAGPNVSFGGSGNQWASSFDPTTGLVTFTNTKGPQQTFTQSITQMVGQGTNAGDLPQSVMSQWQSDYQQHQAGASAGGSSGGFNPMSGNLPSGVTLDQAMSYYQQHTGNPAPDNATAINYFNNAYATSTGNNQLGPFLGQGWNSILTQAGLPSQMTPVEQQTTALTNEAQAEGSSMMQMATTGSGLFPSQQAFIDQTKQQGETEQAAMLAKLGLSESTMAPALKEQADLSADATAGQLVQGNIGLAQASQKIALAGQALETTEQQAVFDMYSSIASESVGFQQNLWNEALQGYGTLGEIIKTSAASYGQSLSGYGAIIQAESASAQNQTALAEASQQADASSTSSLFGSLGKILGGLGGAGGAGAGILGSAGGASLGAGEAATAAVGAAGGSGALAGIGGALTALFCQVAQTVYGFDNPKWEQFRTWLLLRAPLWFVRLYGRNAATISDWLEDKPALRWCLAQVMDLVSQC